MEINDYPHHFKILDCFKKHNLDKDKEEILSTLFEKVKSERNEEQFENNVWHHSLYDFLNYHVKGQIIPKPSKNNFIFCINYIYYCMVVKKMKQKANKLYDKVNKDKHCIAEAYACLAYALSRLHPKLYDMAFEFCESSTEHDPKCGKVWLLLAKLKRKLIDGCNKEYERYLEEASKLLPEDEEIQAEYLEIDDLRITKSIDNTKNTSVLLKMSQYFIRKDKYKEASQLLLKINSIRPQPMSYYLLSLISSKSRQDHISKALELDRLNPAISFLNAHCLINESKFHEAWKQLINTKNNTISTTLKDHVGILLLWIKIGFPDSNFLQQNVSLNAIKPVLDELKVNIDVKDKEKNIWIKSLLKFFSITENEDMHQLCLKHLFALKSGIPLQDLEGFSYDLCFFTKYFSCKEKLKNFKEKKFGLRIIDDTECFYGESKIKNNLEVFHQSLNIVICLSENNVSDHFIDLIVNVNCKQNCQKGIIVLTDEEVDIPFNLKIFPHIKFQESESFVHTFFETIFRSNSLEL